MAVRRPVAAAEYLQREPAREFLRVGMPPLRSPVRVERGKARSNLVEGGGTVLGNDVYLWRATTGTPTAPSVAAYEVRFHYPYDLDCRRENAG
jgi:hypothetical protein